MRGLTFTLIALGLLCVITGLSISPYRVIMKKVAALSTAFLLSNSAVANADNVREVGAITTSGLIFKDTLKITG